MNANMFFFCNIGLSCLCGDVTQPTDDAIRAGRIADSSPDAVLAAVGHVDGFSISIAHCHGHVGASATADYDDNYDSNNVNVTTSPAPAVADQPLGAGLMLAACHSDGYCFKSVHRVDEATTTSYRCIPRSMAMPEERPFMCQYSEAMKDRFMNGCCRDGEMCNRNISIVLPPMPETGQNLHSCYFMVMALLLLLFVFLLLLLLVSSKSCCNCNSCCCCCCCSCFVAVAAAVVAAAANAVTLSFCYVGKSCSVTSTRACYL